MAVQLHTVNSYLPTMITTPNQGYSKVGMGNDDTAALQGTIDYAAGINSSVKLLYGTYVATSNLLIPINPNSQRSIDIFGEGLFGVSKLKFSGAGLNGLVFTGPTSVYHYAPTIRDLHFEADTGAFQPNRGISISWASKPTLKRLFVYGFKESGIWMENVNTAKIDDIQIMRCGDTTRAQCAFNRTTDLVFQNSYIASGSESGVLAGISFDRSQILVVRGNSIESTGIMIDIAGQTEASEFCGPCTIEDNSMEHGPSLPGICYVRCGIGWSSGISCTHLRVFNNRGSTAGGTGITNAVVANRTAYFEWGGNVWGALDAAVADCYYKCFGTTTQRWDGGVEPNNSGFAYPYVKTGSTGTTWIKEAAPWYPCSSHRNIQYDALNDVATPSGAGILQNMLTSTQGGFFSNWQIAPTAAFNLDGTLDKPSNPLTDGYKLRIIAANANLTIRHNQAVTNPFFLKAGANLTLANRQVIIFDHSRPNNRWQEIGNTV